MVAKKGDVVKVHYQAKTKDKTIFDSTTQEPLRLTIGNNEVIPAFEEALVGMNQGEEKTVFIPAKEAFGPYLEGLITKVDKDKIPPNIELQIGQTMQIQKPDGEAILVTLIDIDDKSATFDANHPLAGKDLIFDIKLLEIAS